MARGKSKKGTSRGTKSFGGAGASTRPQGRSKNARDLAAGATRGTRRARGGVPAADTVRAKGASGTAGRLTAARRRPAGKRRRAGGGLAPATKRTTAGRTAGTTARAAGRGASPGRATRGQAPGAAPGRTGARRPRQGAPGRRKPAPRHRGR
jgi:hypothetical protein